MKPLKTKEKVLQTGKSLLQRRGYNGFSFQDIANEIKVKKPSLYDHYASKEELILAILDNYSKAFDQWASASQGFNAKQNIANVFKVFFHFSQDKGKICPVLALACDIKSLSPAILKSMQSFVLKWQSWLEKEIKYGQKAKQIRNDISSKKLAEAIYNQVMGAQYQARIFGVCKKTLEAAGTVEKLITPQINR